MGEGESQVDSPLSMEPDTELDLTTLRLQPEQNQEELDP